MKKIIAGLVLSTALSTPAFAAERGGYVDFDFGSASYSNADFGGPNFNQTFPNPSTYQFGGGYRFNRNLAVEGGLVIMSDATINGFGYTDTLRSSAIYGAAVGIVPVAPQFDLFGKLGLASLGMEEVYNGFSSGTVSQVNIMFGFGAQFNINRNFGVRAQYQNFGSVTYYGGLPAVGLSTLTIGGVFTF